MQENLKITMAVSSLQLCKDDKPKQRQALLQVRTEEENFYVDSWHRVARISGDWDIAHGADIVKYGESIYDALESERQYLEEGDEATEAVLLAFLVVKDNGESVLHTTSATSECTLSADIDF